MNNATDFQPETRNPQNNVSGNLQPNGANLQPVSGTDQSSDLNPNQLPKTDSLKVQNNSSSTGTALPKAISKNNAHSTSTGLFLVSLVLLIGAIIIIAKTQKPAAKSETAETKSKTKESNVLKDREIRSNKAKQTNKKKKRKKRK